MAGLDTVPASYLIVVDESGSMIPLWDGVRSALVTFAEAVPDGSELDVRLFAGTARQRIPATISSGHTRSNWAQELGSIPPPRGAHTDLGRAASAVIEKLRAAPADRLQFVFLLTDGEQDPPPGSPYAAVWNPAWEELAREAQRVAGMRPVRLAIVRLTPEADQHFLARVFPDAISTDAMNATALRGWFQNQTAEAAVEKLLLLISHDLLHRGIEVEPAVVRTFAARPTEVTLRLTSRRQLLSSLIPAGTALDLPGGGTLRAPSDVSIEPGETRDVVLTLADAEYPRYLPPGRRTRTIAQRLALEVRPGPTGELALVGADTTLLATPFHIELTLIGGGALPWSLYLPVVLLIGTALGAGALGAKWKMHRAYLSGRVIIRPSPEDVAGPDPEEKTEQLKGKRLRRYTVTHADREQILTLEARSERGRTVVYAIPHAEVTVRGKRITAPHIVRSAATFETTFGPVTYIAR